MKTGKMSLMKSMLIVLLIIFLAPIYDYSILVLVKKIINNLIVYG